MCNTGNPLLKSGIKLLQVIFSTQTVNNFTLHMNFARSNIYIYNEEIREDKQERETVTHNVHGQPLYYTLPLACISPALQTHIIHYH